MEKEQKLRNYIKQLQSAVVAFSGGVDSSLLLKIALDELGKSNVLAAIGRSQTYPATEFTEASNLAEKLGATYKVIDTDELSDDNYCANPTRRCFYCKSELFEKLSKLALERGFKHVLDGSNKDDEGDFRPGTEAAKNYKVISPLKECGLDKEEVRALAKEQGLENWNKPSLACLASRLPYGQEITVEKLQKIEKAEEFLHNLGISQARVRLDENSARIEVLPQEFDLIFNNKSSINNYFKKLGFVYITLDLEGYKTGSLNRGIDARYRMQDVELPVSRNQHPASQPMERSHA